MTYEDRYQYAVEHHVCEDGWICEQHPDKRWPHALENGDREDCIAPGMPCPYPSCPKSMLNTPHEP